MGRVVVGRVVSLEIKGDAKPSDSLARTPHGVAVRAMKVGQYVDCATVEELQTVRRTLYELGGKPKQRKQREGGWRVWRVA